MKDAKRSTISTKATQAAYYDRQKFDEFEIERPRGTGRLYEYLLRFKFRRGLDLLGESLAGRTVLCICAGAGMDVEFLAEAGARVVALDLSHGALLAARERSRRHAFSAAFVAADAERLPFAARSFDYCYVHDGLHHLDDPRKAIGELARVARRGVVVTEPADAALTRVAIWLGILAAREEAGNFVIRFTPESLTTHFRIGGFPHTRATRYLMRYPHVPGPWFRFLSSPLAFPVARAAHIVIGNSLLACLGNKMSFAARR